MSGSEPYKFGWTNGVRRLRLLALYPATFRGYLAFATIIGPRWRLREMGAARALRRYLEILQRDPSAILPWRLKAHSRAR